MTKNDKLTGPQRIKSFLAGVIVSGSGAWFAMGLYPPPAIPKALGKDEGPFGMRVQQYYRQFRYFPIRYYGVSTGIAGICAGLVSGIWRKMMYV